MQSEIVARLERVERAIVDLQRKLTELERSVNERNTSPADTPNTMQLAVLKQENAKMLAKMGTMLHSTISKEVDAKLVPIKAAVAYSMEDAAGTVDSYRREVNRECEAISYGDVDRRSITKYLSTVFDDRDGWDQ